MYCSSHGSVHLAAAKLKGFASLACQASKRGSISSIMMKPPGFKILQIHKLDQSTARKKKFARLRYRLLKWLRDQACKDFRGTIARDISYIIRAAQVRHFT